MPEKLPNSRVKPSESIKEKDNDKKELDKEKIKNTKKLEVTEINVKGIITAGTWVAEVEKGTIRKASLRG